MREEYGTTMLSVVEEVLVVEKRWMLREEIHSRTQRLETAPAPAYHAAQRRRTD